MSKVEVVPVKLSHIDYVAENMRQADIDEVMAASGREPKRALSLGVLCSPQSWTMLVDGKPVAIGGVFSINVIYGEGVPWILGTTDLESNMKSFLRISKEYLELVLRYHSYLSNYVDVRNELAIKYLKWLGFSIGEPEPFGFMKKPFRKFELRADHV